MKNIFFLLFLLLTTIPVVCQELTKSELERNNAAAKIYKEKSALKKEEIFKDWLNKYPPLNFPQSTALYDYAKIELSKSFALAGNLSKALEYANQVQLDRIKAEAWATTAAALASRNFVDEAINLYEKAINKSVESTLSKKNESGNDPVDEKIVDYSFELSQLFYKQGKYDSAVSSARFSYLANYTFESSRLDIAKHLINCLIATGKDSSALIIAGRTFSDGIADSRMRLVLKQLYLKVLGNTGMSEFLEKTFTQLHAKKKKALKEKMIELPAPDFKLKDLDGQWVSLSKSKGKITVIDFWATWCIPCRQTFPYMQKAVDFYKDNPDVQFLFIHTWEHEKDATKQVAKFIKGNNYSFRVLMDLKDPVTEVNNVVESFHVPALPAQIIIDKQGRVRFFIRTNGRFEMSDEDALEELQAMIELVSER